jgi:hypothetical protein
LGDHVSETVYAILNHDGISKARAHAQEGGGTQSYEELGQYLIQHLKCFEDEELAKKREGTTKRNHRGNMSQQGEVACVIRLRELFERTPRVMQIVHVMLTQTSDSRHSEVEAEELDNVVELILQHQIRAVHDLELLFSAGANERGSSAKMQSLVARFVRSMTTPLLEHTISKRHSWVLVAALKACAKIHIQEPTAELVGAVGAMLEAMLANGNKEYQEHYTYYYTHFVGSIDGELFTDVLRVWCLLLHDFPHVTVTKTSGAPADAKASLAVSEVATRIFKHLFELADTLTQYPKEVHAEEAERANEIWAKLPSATRRRLVSAACHQGHDTVLLDHIQQRNTPASHAHTSAQDACTARAIDSIAQRRIVDRIGATGLHSTELSWLAEVLIAATNAALPGVLEVQLALLEHFDHDTRMLAIMSLRGHPTAEVQLLEQYVEPLLDRMASIATTTSNRSIRRGVSSDVNGMYARQVLSVLRDKEELQPATMTRIEHLYDAYVANVHYTQYEARDKSATGDGDSEEGEEGGTGVTGHCLEQCELHCHPSSFDSGIAAIEHIGDRHRRELQRRVEQSCHAVCWSKCDGHDMMIELFVELIRRHGNQRIFNVRCSRRLAEYESRKHYRSLSSSADSKKFNRLVDVSVGGRDRKVDKFGNDIIGVVQEKTKNNYVSYQAGIDGMQGAIDLGYVYGLKGHIDFPLIRRYEYTVIKAEALFKFDFAYKFTLISDIGDKTAELGTALENIAHRLQPAFQLLFQAHQQLEGMFRPLLDAIGSIEHNMGNFTRAAEKADSLTALLPSLQRLVAVGQQVL